MRDRYDAVRIELRRSADRQEQLWHVRPCLRRLARLHERDVCVMRGAAVVALALACAPLVARAQGEPPPDAGVAPPPDAPPEQPAAPTPQELAQRIQDLEDKQAQLE